MFIYRDVVYVYHFFSLWESKYYKRYLVIIGNSLPYSFSVGSPTHNLALAVALHSWRIAVQSLLDEVLK